MGKNWYKKNKEKANAWRKNHYQENKEQEKAQVKARREYIKWRADAWRREMAQMQADIDGVDVGEVNAW